MAVKYELFEIVSANGENSVNLYDGQFRVLSFDYYESIVSPHITGSLVISSSTGAAKSKDDAEFEDLSDVKCMVYNYCFMIYQGDKSKNP